MQRKLTQMPDFMKEGEPFFYTGAEVGKFKDALAYSRVAELSCNLEKSCLTTHFWRAMETVCEKQK